MRGNKDKSRILLANKKGKSGLGIIVNFEGSCTPSDGSCLELKCTPGHSITPGVQVAVVTRTAFAYFWLVHHLHSFLEKFFWGQ